MPYELRRVNGKHCVAKKGAEATLKCYAARDDAVRYMRALYANVADATVASLETAVTAASFSSAQRERFAKSGIAMPDGSFPIRNKSDLSNALQSLGRAKDRTSVVAHIRKRAKALGLDEMVRNLTAAGVSLKVAEAEKKHPGNKTPNPAREQKPLEQAIRALRAAGARMKECPACMGEGMVEAEPGDEVVFASAVEIEVNVEKSGDERACLQCGALNDGDAAFCDACGASMEQEEVSAFDAGLPVVSSVDLAGITASAAGAAPDVAPAEWFENPGLGEAIPLTVTPEGRVFGYVAAWGTCHTGIQGRCVTPPESSDGMPYFNLASVRTDKGVINAGKITMDTGHAPLTAGSKIAASHYDNTGVVAADVRAGQDEHGIWVAGAVRPDLDVNRARALERATVSGDWRRIDGRHEMVGLLAVNVPGFPIPRAQAAVTAAADGSDMVTALVAAGVLCGCSDLEHELDMVVADSVGHARAGMRGRRARHG